MYHFSKFFFIHQIWPFDVYDTGKIGQLYCDIEVWLQNKNTGQKFILKFMLGNKGF